VVGIFHVAGCDTGSVVVSSHRRRYCRVMGVLLVDICAVSNIKVYGYHISGEYMKIACVLTCLSGHHAGGELLVRYGSFCCGNIPD
jgi:hypothetical protein